MFAKLLGKNKREELLSYSPNTVAATEMMGRDDEDVYFSSWKNAALRNYMKHRDLIPPIYMEVKYKTDKKSEDDIIRRLVEAATGKQENMSDNV